MAMKVSGINNAYFKGVQVNAPQFDVKKSEKEIHEISNITPDYNVKTPKKYIKTGTDNLPNGLKLYSYKLSNGYRVSIVPMQDSPAVVKTYVNVGAVNETPDIKGISHFLEHMAFNGTKGDDGHIKLQTGDSFKKIDALGGWANASTNYALTDYVNVSPLLNKADLETQIKVLAAMNEDLKLSNEMIEKEKGPVCSEINMILDDPKTIAIDQTFRTLFNVKNPADEFVAGSVKHIQNLTRKDVVDYYNKYYSPANTNIVVTGDVDPNEVIKLISQNFVSEVKPLQERREEVLSPLQKTVRKDFLSNKAKSAEIVLGFEGVKNNSTKEKILFNIAANYIESETVGLTSALKQYNTDFIIDDERVSTKPDGSHMTYMALTSSEQNSENVLKTIFDKINNVKPISSDELERIKDGIKEARNDKFEYSECINGYIGQSVLDNTISDISSFDKILDSITPQEVDSAIKKYFDLNKTAITVVHPQNRNDIAFKGRNRMPVNIDKVSVQTLNNNVAAGFYSTDSARANINVRLATDIPYNKNAAAREVLNQIYSMGTSEYTEDEFNKIKEELNLGISTYSGVDGINISLTGNEKNYEKGIKFVNDLIYKPRIDSKTLEIAKQRVKENIMKSQTTASSLYYDEFYSKYNKYAFSQQEVLDALDNLTLDDVKELHNYIMNNSRGIVTANIPVQYGEKLKNDVLKFASSMKEVLPNNVNIPKQYKSVQKPIVLSSAQNNSQADIKQVYNFEFKNSLKNKATAKIMNSILSSSSIGLFDTLREKEHLAYSVYSDIATSEDWGELSLNILTTTDNKETGEKKYENVQRSIDGFNRQIKKLLSGEFTDEDIENAKRSIKAQLLNKEGTNSKVSSVTCGLDSKFGVGYQNDLFNEIDGITREDILDFAKNVFSNNPVYSITATENTLNANKNYLDSLRKQ